MQHKIEIIIPAYNCKKTLDRTLASLECQTFTDFLVHLIDDCSEEDLSIIVKKHSGLNIRVTRNQKNLGCGMSRQIGMDQTQADYIAFLDADDVLMPYTVEIWHNQIRNSENNVDIFHSWFYEQLNENDNLILKTKKDGYTWCHGKLYKVDFLRKFGIREFPEVRWADDSAINSQCTELGTMAVIEIPMYIWMNNHESITRDKNGSFRLSEGKIDDFIRAIRLSTENVLRYKNHVSHLKKTLDFISKFESEITNWKDYEFLKGVRQVE